MSSIPFDVPNPVKIKELQNIQAYQTTSGELHANLADAKFAQVHINLVAYLDREVESSPDKKAIIQFVINHKNELRQLLDLEAV